MDKDVKSRNGQTENTETGSIAKNVDTGRNGNESDADAATASYGCTESGSRAEAGSRPSENKSDCVKANGEENAVDFEPGTCVRSGSELMKDNETALLASLGNESRESKERKAKKKQKKKTVKALIWSLCLVVFAAVVAFFVTTVFLDFVGANHPLDLKSEVEVDISKGSSLAEVGKALGDAGVIRYPSVFKLYVKTKGDFSKFKYGLYVMSGDMSYSDIIDALIKPGKSADTVKVMIPEGSNVDTIAALLEKSGVCKASDFKKIAKKGDFEYDFLKDIPDTVYYKLEGYLYPDTYDFYAFGGEEGAIRAARRMLDNFKAKLPDDLIKTAQNRGFTLHQTLTMASIIEMESGSAAYTDKEKVSAVFYNRLAWTTEPNLLGSSPTASYPYGDGAYDTNKTRGLPPGPLCSPGIKSIEASARPAKNFDMCYFVTDKNNKFYYNKTYSEHLQTISSLRQKGLWK